MLSTDEQRGTRTRRWLVAAAGLWPLAQLVAGTTEVQESGLRRCFDSGGTEIVCTGTGQDGDIRPGVEWPVPRLVDNGDGTVTDRLTGLMWLKDAGCSGPFGWLTALTTVDMLNAGDDLGCAGYAPGRHGDWRVPNVVELTTLIDYGSTSGLPAGHPFIEPGCSGTFPTWTSTTNAVSGEEDQAWAVAHGVAGVPQIATANKQSTSGCLWPVRDAAMPDGGAVSLSLADGGIKFADGSVQATATPLGTALPRRSGQVDCWNSTGVGQSCTSSNQDGEVQAGVAWPVPRYTDNLDGTVTDELTGLIWMLEVGCLGVVNTFSDGETVVTDLNNGNEFNCSGYTAGTFDDWRMPSITELVSLQHYGTTTGMPAIHPFDFTGITACGFWSSTKDVTNPTDIWRVIHGPAAVVRDVEAVDRFVDSCVWVVRDRSL